MKDQSDFIAENIIFLCFTVDNYRGFYTKIYSFHRLSEHSSLQNPNLGPLGTAQSPWKTVPNHEAWYRTNWIENG